jgi:hypothetical protein
MTHRERFFATVAGRQTDRAAFIPDISDWYISLKTPPGKPRRFAPGAFIPDQDPIHQREGTLQREFRELTYLDYYRKFDWGLPVHIYDWFEVQYDGIDRTVLREGDRKITRLACPKGELQQVQTLAYDGSWAPTEYFAKDLRDLEIVKYIVEHSRFVPKYDYISQVLAGIGSQGVCDVVIPRSPFGKLLHIYLGFRQLVYALYDQPEAILDFLAFQEGYDLKLIELAALAPARIVIMSDHTDEILVSPKYYRDYCIPFYQKANRILHDSGKLVSTHLDGNIKGYFPLLSETGFDLLDGCTPAPMTNYEVEELARALPTGMSCYCGVPAALFCQEVKDEVIVEFGRRILDAFAGRVILNVGDILPANGDIYQVIHLGEFAKGYNNRWLSP